MHQNHLKIGCNKNKLDGKIIFKKLKIRKKKFHLLDNLEIKVNICHLMAQLE